MTKLSAVAQSLLLGTALSLTALHAPPAQAVIGALDRVPSATLLLPYFEVDLGNPNGVQTRFTVINSSATPQLAHAVLWTDMGVPTFSADIYLGGRDSVEVDLRLLFAGVVPQTAPNLFNAGPYSSPHTAIAGCPLAANALYSGMPASPLLSATQIAHLRAAHTGQSSASFGGMCSAASHGDSIARGYVTIDAVNTCSSAFPTDANYFVSGGSGVASNANVLFGQYTLIERSNAVATSNPLVSIEASGTDALTTTSGTSTFYGGYVGFNASDNREVLPNRWRARNLNVAFFDPGTEIIGWRDPVLPHTPFTCNNPPADFPRGQTTIVSFDEQEHPVVLNAAVVYPNPQPPPTLPFPLITQRVQASDMSPYAAGSIFMNFNGTLSGSANGTVQSYVGVRHQFHGIFGAALPGEAMDVGSDVGGF